MSGLGGEYLGGGCLGGGMGMERGRGRRGRWRLFVLLGLGGLLCRLLIEEGSEVFFWRLVCARVVGCGFLVDDT